MILINRINSIFNHKIKVQLLDRSGFNLKRNTLHKVNEDNQRFLTLPGVTNDT